MDSRQREEVKVRSEILEILAKAYRHAGLSAKIKKLRRMKRYHEAVSLIHEIEHEMKKRKREAFRKKLREKFRKGKKKRKSIKRKKR